MSSESDPGRHATADAPQSSTPAPTFQSVFLAVFLGTVVLVAALLVNQRRPAIEVQQPSAEHVLAVGKCAECHRRETPAIVEQYETSLHASRGVTCLECHQPQEGQEARDHNGFRLSRAPTAKSCAACHATEYEQFRRSRHAYPAWAAVVGAEGFTADELAFGEQHHPGMVNRPANALARLEGQSAIQKGCASCHAVGKPNPDGSVGTCTQCHARHSTSVELARLPATCGQCHMGPDHSQLEIYSESKHGVLFEAQRDRMNLKARPRALTTKDMAVPTCATCHMSGLDGQKVTHDTTERLSWTLYAPVSEKRPAYARGQQEMKELCARCHSRSHIEDFYRDAEAVVADTNRKVREVEQLVASVRAEGLLTTAPFDEPLEFQWFDYWHYWGRTAKHGAFMGGADFVQWHGNYELLKERVAIEAEAEALRREARHD